MLSCNSMLSRCCLLPTAMFERECRRALARALLSHDCMLSSGSMLPCDECERECRRCALAHALLSIDFMLSIDIMLPCDSVPMPPRQSSLLVARVIPSDVGAELDEFDVLQAHELRLPALNCRYASRCLAKTSAEGSGTSLASTADVSNFAANTFKRRIASSTVCVCVCACVCVCVCVCVRARAHGVWCTCRLTACIRTHFAPAYSEEHTSSLTRTGSHTLSLSHTVDAAP